MSVEACPMDIIRRYKYANGGVSPEYDFGCAYRPDNWMFKGRCEVERTLINPRKRHPKVVGVQVVGMTGNYCRKYNWTIEIPNKETCQEVTENVTD